MKILENNSGSLRRNRFSRLAAIITFAAVACCGLTVFAVRAYNKVLADRPSLAAPAGTKPSLNPASASGSQKNPVEVAVVTIRPDGFEPTEITRSKGLFFLAVENRSGLQTMQIRIDDQAGNRLQDAQMPIQKHDWHKGLDLPPGRYTLSEAYHPDWSCRITIEGE